MNWLEKLKLAAESGGVSLSEEDCHQLARYLAMLEDRVRRAQQ